MRKFVLIAAGAVLAAGCQSLTVVNKTPDRKVVADLLLRSLKCEEDALPAAGDGAAVSADAAPASEKSSDAKKCDPAAQPKKVELTSLQCAPRPLRVGVAEAAYAQCSFAGNIVRADGAVTPLPISEGDFSLFNLTPGAYRPLYDWGYDDAK